jgi:hypothetical protein
MCRRAFRCMPRNIRRRLFGAVKSAPRSFATARVLCRTVQARASDTISRCQEIIMHSSHTGWSSPTGSHSVTRRRAQRSAGRQPLHTTQSFSGIGMRRTRSSARGPRGPVFIVPVCVVAFNTAEGRVARRDHRAATSARRTQLHLALATRPQ